MNFDNIGASIIALLFGALALMVVGAMLYGITYLFTPYGPHFTRTAKVKTMSYHAAHTSTGVSSKGSLVTTYTPSEFDVILTLDTGEPWILDDENFFNAVEQGEHLELIIRNKRVWGSDNWDLVSWTKL